MQNLKLHKAIFMNISNDRRLLYRKDKDFIEQQVYAQDTIEIFNAFKKPFGSMEDMRWEYVDRLFNDNNYAFADFQDDVIVSDAVKTWEPELSFINGLLRIGSYMGGREVEILKTGENEYSFECNYYRPSLTAAAGVIALVGKYDAHTYWTEEK